MRRAVERRIEDDTSEGTAAVLRPVPQLDPAPLHSDVERIDDDLRVTTQEGDVAVIRDLQPERGSVGVIGADTSDEAVVDVIVADDRAAEEVVRDEVVTETDLRSLRAPDGATQARYRMLVAGHIASDIFCLNVVLLATGMLEAIAVSRSLGTAGWMLTIVGSVAWIAIFHAFGLYASKHLSSAEEIRRVVGAASVGAALLMIFGAGGLTNGNELGFAFVMLVVLEVVARLSWRRYARSLRTKGLLAYRTVIVGSAHDATFVARAVDGDDRSGFYPIGRIATEAGPDEPAAPPFLGSIADAARLIDENSVEALIVASPTLTTAELGRLQQLARRRGLALRLVARVPHMLTNRLTLQRVGPLMTVAVRPAELTGTQAALKRAFDITLASVALVISLPIQALVGVLVGVTSPGPVLFRQQRVTRGNKLFTVYKFRTMDRDADRIMDERAVDRTQPFFKGGEAPITPVGRVLRSLSLDELPQLWNVVKGDMSLVGPRPLTAEQVWANPEMLGPRHDVRTGLTGWWQVNGRSDVSAEEAIKQDLFYIENWSLLLDLYIMLRTVGVLLTRKGAR
jgi:exopolysaccharide biosynthesis polyprenyl glycosylphosphotransferase